MGIILVPWKYTIANLVGGSCNILNNKSSVFYLLFLSWSLSSVFSHSIFSLFSLFASRLVLGKGHNNNNSLANLNVFWFIFIISKLMLFLLFVIVVFILLN